MKQQLIQSHIDNSLEETLTSIYNQLGITTGDITPEQQMKWENLVTDMSILFEQLIEQNK